MAVRRDACVLWRRPPADALARTRRALEQGLDRMDAPACQVFFRADDCGVPSRAWEVFLAPFLTHRVPLALALVPAWTTPARWGVLRGDVATAPELFTWHQHGRRHINHEPTGKKMEFGPSRSNEDLERDIRLGWRRLQAITGQALVPVFTPPWNRVSGATMDILVEQGFAAISRFARATPPPPPALPDLFVNLDLHTRKDADAESAWATFLQALEDCVASGWLGVMCHHQRMNRAAQAWLDAFLPLVLRHPKVQVQSLSELAHK